MKKSILLIFALLFFVIPTAYSSTCVYYFYGEGCPHCANVVPFLDEMLIKYPELELHKYETWYNTENSKLFTEIAKKYSLPMQGVPTVVIGSENLIGDKPIIGKLEGLITKYKDAPCPTTDSSLVGVPDNSGTTPTDTTQNNAGAVVFYVLIGICILVILILVLTRKHKHNHEHKK